MQKSFAILMGMAMAVAGQSPLPHSVLPTDLEDQARYQLYAAYGAYCHKSKLEAWDCKWCKDMGPAKVYGVTENFIGTGGQAFVVRNNQSMIIVSFRGSHNIQNWLEDFNYLKTDLTWPGVPKGVEVHRGFLESYNALKPDLLKWVVQAQQDCPNCTLHVTGHSLGAAEATLCTTELRLLGNDPFMWTYGEPRVGNKEFFEFFYANTTHPVYRMVNKRDIVPHVPPADFGFHHRQREIWRVANGTYIMCDNTGEDKHCSDSIPLELTNAVDHLEYMGLHESC
eukprot:TRINITY_DN4186_c0_g1_i1.p1 TRINITY_DN4186_c0_g1~~TRINITY_DN4186_c0_g1_i1.p1  ORF type:complete len:282 (+),score=94.30 TRINITY_DN4186_c0_g1_i1:57-902(+)